MFDPKKYEENMKRYGITIEDGEPGIYVAGEKKTIDELYKMLPTPIRATAVFSVKYGISNENAAAPPTLTEEQAKHLKFAC